MKHEPMHRRSPKYKTVMECAQNLIDVLEQEKQHITWRAHDNVTVALILMRRALEDTI